MALLLTFAFVVMTVTTLIALVRPSAAPIVAAPAVVQPAQPTVNTGPVNLTTNPGRTVGTNATAPLVVEFADFQCPYCRQFAAGAQKGIVAAAKQGKVRFAYKYFPFLGQESFDAAYAAECANRQGKFWEYEDLLTTNWQGENVGGFAPERLKAFAAQIKLDATKFDACLDDQETAAIIDAEIAEGRQAGVRGTPTFYVNSRLFNAPSFQSADKWATIWGGR
jgi:protein-disulfide isomerase